MTYRVDVSEAGGEWSARVLVEDDPDSARAAEAAGDTSWHYYTELADVRASSVLAVMGKAAGVIYRHRRDSGSL